MWTAAFSRFSKDEPPFHSTDRQETHLKRRLVFIAAAVCSLCSPLALAAGYPDRPIEFIVPSSAGG